MKYFSPLLKEPQLIDNLPVVIRLSKFDESNAKGFSAAMMKAQNTGQPVIPIIIDSYGGQVYSLMFPIVLIYRLERDVDQLLAAVLRLFPYLKYV